MPAIPMILVCHSPGLGGTELYTLRLAHALAERGHEVTILATGKDVFSPRVLHDRVRVRTHLLTDHGRPDRVYRAWAGALRPMSGPMVVLMRGDGTWPPLPVLAALRRRFGRVYTIHHMPVPNRYHPVIHQGGLTRRPPAAWLKRWMLSRLCRRAIACADSVAAGLRVAYDLPTPMIVTSRNWIDIDAFAPDDAQRRQQRAQLGLAEDELVIGFLGRFSEEKQPELLLHGYAEFVRTRPGKSRLILAGDGPLRARVAQQVKELNLPERVLLPGQVANPAAWHRVFDIEVLPSQFEGMPLALLEALACGTLTLATPVGGMAECIDPGRTGFLAPLRDAAELAGELRRIAELGPDARARIAVAARRDMEERFSAAVGLPRLLLALEVHDG